MASYTEKFKLFKYNPTTDGEANFSINQALNENWDKIDEAIANVCGLSIGDIGISLYVDESSGLRRRLNGTTISINNNTRAFYNYLKNLQSLHPELFTTETNWQSEVTLSDLGQCGKFVIDEAGGTIRLPKVVNIQGVMDIAQCGMTVKAGLPNIKGSVQVVGSPYTSGNLSTTNIDNSQLMDKSGGGGWGYPMTLYNDASKSSAIYGNSETVQQEAVQYPFFIQIATGASESVDIKNEIVLNNPYSFGDSKYSPFELNNLSWLKSTGQYNSKVPHIDFYNWILEQRNKGTVQTYGWSKDTSFAYWTLTESVEVGTEVYGYTPRRICGKVTEVGDDTITVQDTFSSNSIVCNKDVSMNGKTYIAKTGGVNFLIPGEVSATSGNDGYDNDYDFVINTSDETFRLPIESKLASGKAIVDDETSNKDLYLYFYVGETVQNANLIDAGRIQEQITEINARPYIKETYDDGNGNGYRVYSNGYCEQWGFSAGLSGSSVGMRTINTYKTYRNEFYYRVGTYKFEETSWNSATNSSPSLSNTANVVPFLCLATPNSFQVGRTVPLLWFTAGFLAKGEY